MVSQPAIRLGLLLLVVFFALFTLLLKAQLPSEIGFFALFQPSDNLELLLVQNYTLPRITMALLAGGILGFASLLLQQVLANPLASDYSLGISSGSQFALFLTAIFAPQWLENGSTFIALLGALLSLLLVLSLAMRKSMSALLLVLAGLVVNLYFGSFSAMMMLFYPEEARGLSQWGAGSLVQDSWRDSLWLMAQAVPAFVLVAILIRPLTILLLNDSNARSLGVAVGKLRLIGVLIASFLIAIVVSAVGMLGFIGLGAATIVRQLGVRTLNAQLIVAFGFGALLLGVTDLLLQLLAHFKAVNLPTGSVTALLGTPLLLWLMFKAVPHSGRVQEAHLQNIRKISPLVIGVVGLGFMATLWGALFIGNGNSGLALTDITTGWGRELLEIRYPRVLVALSVGVLLALAGVILQRLTLNPMASPELLGVSSGASMGVLVVLFLFSAQQTEYFWLAGVLGSLAALVVITLINQKSGMLPEKVLLTGIALSAFFDTLQRIAIASGDPRANQLLAWTSASTQSVNAELAIPFAVLSILLLLCGLIFSRWLDLLALQAPMAQALGLNLKRIRLILILFSAVLTALATLIIGPLSFIGLLVPQIARFLGATKSHHQLLFSALLGGLIMVLADWFGRQIMFPYEVPAGLVATLLGGSYFLLMVRKV
ncbi:TPA: Fe(3+)-hydroxamate ABC transporter permease FhuB [Mannheimia haemolytica]